LVEDSHEGEESSSETERNMDSDSSSYSNHLDVPKSRKGSSRASRRNSQRVKDDAVIKFESKEVKRVKHAIGRAFRTGEGEQYRIFTRFDPMVEMRRD
jgi:hypothetical protein